VAARHYWWTKLFKFHFASSVSSSNISEFDCFLTDKVARYENRPDLQFAAVVLHASYLMNPDSEK
jgi:hypothetical protein